MKIVYFYAVFLNFSVSWLGIDLALAGHQTNLIYANKNRSEDKNLVSQSPAKVENFVAFGTEPFWSVTVNRNGIVYSSPEVSKRTYPYVAPIKAEGRPIDVVRVYRLNGQPNGTLIIKKTDSCSDGMSDNVYPYEAILILGNQVMEGCAERR